MSNYFISKCCKAEVKYLLVAGRDTKGQCSNCLKTSSLEAVIDNQEFKEKADNNNLTNI